MEKRVILAFVLSFVVLYAFRALFTPPSSGPASLQAPESPVVNTTPPPAKTPVTERETATPLSAETTIKAEKSEDVVFETPLYVATGSNVGGVLKSFKLKGYSDEHGNPLELINQEVGSRVGWPLALTSGDKAVDDQLQNALFVATREKDRLILEFASNGLHVRKAIRFDDQNYLFTLDTTLAKDGKPIAHDVVWQGSFGDQSIPQDPARKNAVYQVDAAFKRIALRSAKDPAQTFMSLRAGVEDQYFAAMILSTDMPVAVKIGKRDYPGPDGKPIPTLVVATSMPDTKSVRVYVGPKHRDWLSK